MIASISCRRPPSNLPNLPTCTDNSGVNTWTQIADGTASGGSTYVRLTVFKCQAAASPGTFTVTTASTSAGAVICSVEEFTGADSDLSNISSVATSTTGDPSATLPGSPAASSIVLGTFMSASAITPTLPSSYTQIINRQVVASSTLNTSYKQTTTAGAAWTSTGLDSCACLLEVKEASSGVTGTGAGIIAPLTGDGVGLEAFIGSGAGVIAPLAGAGVGSEVFAGSGAGVIAPLAGSGVGSESITGTGAGVIAPLVGAGVGGGAITGIGSGVLAALTGSGAGVLAITGSGSGLLAQLVGEGVGVHDDGGVGPLPDAFRSHPMIVTMGQLMGR